MIDLEPGTNLVEDFSLDIDKGQRIGIIGKNGYGKSTILKLIAPIMPFITEEIYQTYFKKTEVEESIHISNWPSIKSASEKDAAKWDFLITEIAKVRQGKTKAKESMNATNIYHINSKTYKELGSMRESFAAVTGSELIPVEKKERLTFEAGTSVYI